MKEFFRKYRYPLLLGIGIFLFTFLFFSLVHPLYPYDLDDWKIMHRMRPFYPSIFEWNPTRVLPEILMPRCGEFAMAVVYPFTKDITTAICLTTATLLALLISAYMVVFYRMIRRNFTLTKGTSTLLTLFFFIFHFLIFRSGNTENQHLFYSYDLTDHIFYTIPNILNSIFVLLFMTDGFRYFRLKGRTIIKGFFLLLLYFALYSNLFDSIVLSSFIGVYLLLQLIVELRKKSKITDFIKQYRLHLIVILLWLVAVAFEPFGGNSQVITSETGSFSDALIESIRNFRHVLLVQTNQFAVCLLFIFILSYLILCWRKERLSHTSILFYSSLGAAVVSGIFLALLGAASFPYYLLRIMSVYAVPFFLILAGFICFATCLQRYPKVAVLLPFLVLATYCNIQKRGKVFQDVQTFQIENTVQYRYQVSPREIHEQNRNYIQAICDADREGKDTLILAVPRFEQDGNWPISWSHGDNLLKFLYMNHLVSRKFPVILNPRDPSAEIEDSEVSKAPNDSTY